MIKLYHIEGLNHSDNMTIVYRPKEKIVINADIYGGRPQEGTCRMSMPTPLRCSATSGG